MKKSHKKASAIAYSKTLIVLSVVLPLIVSCQRNPESSKNVNSPEDKNENLSILSFINEERTYYGKENDSVNVRPFQFYSIVEFKEIDYGLHESLLFSVHDSIQECNVLNTKRNLKNPFKELSFSFEDFVKLDSSNSIEIRLPTRDGEIIRRIEKNKKYKVLYYYIIDSEVYRENIGTDDFIEGMAIIDVVSIYEDFNKDEPI